LRNLLFILVISCAAPVYAQTLGGAAAFNFLKLPPAPLLSAVGGVNTSYKGSDVGMAVNNPSLLDPSLNAQVDLSFNSFYAGIKSYSLAGAWYAHGLGTMFGGNIFFVDYGSIAQTDAAGNEMGSFHPKDFVVQASAARTYLERWHYGATIKFIVSDYEFYRSSALALDVGVFYEDSVRLFAASVLAKNMGLQLKSYAGNPEDLPFDLQVGATKRLKGSPFGFSLTLQQIHRFNLFYNDALFNNQNNITSTPSFFNKFFNHVVIATHIYLGSNLQAIVGYNQLRRSELNIGSNGNGLNGFSLGLQASFKKLKFQYARSYFQRGSAYNQFGIGLNLPQLAGIGSL
jgi:hypothetical protein